MTERKVHPNLKQRIIIKLLVKEGLKPVEICKRLKEQFLEDTLSDISIYKWCKIFKEGREFVRNKPHNRQP